VGKENDEGRPMPASGNSQTTGLADQSHDF
jgi:hypothetical protein